MILFVSKIKLTAIILFCGLFCCCGGQKIYNFGDASASEDIFELLVNMTLD